MYLKVNQKHQRTLEKSFKLYNKIFLVQAISLYCFSFPSHNQLYLCIIAHKYYCFLSLMFSVFKLVCSTFFFFFWAKMLCVLTFYYIISFAFFNDFSFQLFLLFPLYILCPTNSFAKWVRKKSIVCPELGDKKLSSTQSDPWRRKVWTTPSPTGLAIMCLRWDLVGRDTFGQRRVWSGLNGPTLGLDSMCLRVYIRLGLGLVWPNVYAMGLGLTLGLRRFWAQIVCSGSGEVQVRPDPNVSLLALSICSGSGFDPC